MYALHDYDPERDGDEEAWAAGLAEQGGGCGSQGLAPGSLSKGTDCGGGAFDVTHRTGGDD